MKIKIERGFTMALVTCPECRQMVSDQAKSCPNCGFPLTTANQDINETQNNSEDFILSDSAEDQTSMTHSESTKKKKSILAIGIIAVVCVFAILIISVLANNHAKQQAAIEARQEYIDNLNDFLYKALDGGAKSETVCNLTKRVWYDTIYEEYNSDTAPYTQTNGVYNDDFNVSLQKLYSSQDMIDSVAYIELNQEEVEKIYKSLMNPTDEFQKCFEEVEKLYSAYYRFTKLAISPSGSLKTYSEDFLDVDGEFMEHFDKLKLLIPAE